MRVIIVSILASSLYLATTATVSAAETPTAGTLYQQHCASCHGAERLGAMGPALLPENLKRLKKKQAKQVINNGRAATQMPAFADTLNEAQVDALVELIYTPLDTLPVWGEIGAFCDAVAIHPAGQAEYVTSLKDCLQCISTKLSEKRNLRINP